MTTTTTERLSLIAQAVCECKGCKLHESRRLAVPGNGSVDTRLMLVGEGPGANEDERGEPFVGKAGELLNNILAAAGISRKLVFVTNAVKCRPPGNRTPFPQEIAACNGFLRLQIKTIDPQVILCLGVVAAKDVLRRPVDSIGALRGVVHSVEGRNIVCTYHPSFLLRNPAAKPDVWEDIQIVLNLLSQPTISSTAESTGVAM